MSLDNVAVARGTLQRHYITLSRRGAQDCRHKEQSVVHGCGGNKGDEVLGRVARLDKGGPGIYASSAFAGQSRGDPCFVKQRADRQIVRAGSRSACYPSSTLPQTADPVSSRSQQT